MPGEDDSDTTQAHVEGEERRLAAVLVGDVVGYTRLIGEDEAHTVRTLNAYREEIRLLVSQHRGRLVDFTGDQFLAEFPSALYAVRCALDIQGALRGRNAQLPEDRRIEFRIGAHLGDVRVEGDRLFGAGVNVAARLQTLAEPGGLCISGAIHTELQNRISLSYEALGAQDLKNVAEPVHAYKVEMPPVTPKEHLPPRPRRPRWQLAFAAGAIAAIVAGGWWITRPEAPGPELSGPIRSIAVLPLENLSGDPDQDYVADGMTEALIGDLAKIGSLRVISRTSVNRYKNSDKSLPEIAKELGVDGVIEGTVILEADRVRVTAQLIDARSDSHLWADRYDRELSGVLALQSEVARAVAEQVRLELTPEEQVVLTASRPVDEEAYDAYLRGLSHFGPVVSGGTWTPKALEELERAVALDPEFAEAWAQLAVVRTVIAMGQRDYFPKVREAAEKALELDPRLGRAHTSLGFVRYFYDWDQAAASHSYERALELSPNDPDVLFGYYVSLAWRERFEEGVEISDRMLRVAPRDLIWRSQRIQQLEGMRLYERAIEEADLVRELEPGFVNPAEANLYARLGRFEEGHSSLVAALEQCGAPCDELRKAAEDGWAEGGYEGKLRALAEHGEQMAASGTPVLGASTMAELYANAGEMDRAFEWLERGVEARNPILVELNWFPDFDAMRLDPRFDALLKRMNLPTTAESPSRMADVGRLLAFRGRPSEAISRLERAMAQSPDDPRLSRWLDSMMWAHFAASDYQQAASWAQRVLARDVSTRAAAFAYLLLASSYAHLDRPVEAREALDEALTLWPTLEIDRDLRPLFLGGEAALRDRYLGGLHKAGYLEHAARLE